MKRYILALMGVGLALALPATSASARNYDCTKAGNANKTECKAAAKPATVAKPASSKAVTAPASARNYDCTKPGNANKAARRATVSGSAEGDRSISDCCIGPA